MNATTTRKIVDNYYEQRRLERETKSKKFVDNLVKGKIRNRATKGYFECKAKLPKGCSRFVVRDELKARGFSVSGKITFFGVKFIIQW